MMNREPTRLLPSQCTAAPHRTHSCLWSDLIIRCELHRSYLSTRDLQMQLHGRRDVSHERIEIEFNDAGNPRDVTGDRSADQLSHRQTETSSAIGHEHIETRADLSPHDRLPQTRASAFVIERCPSQ